MVVVFPHPCRPHEDHDFGMSFRLDDSLRPAELQNHLLVHIPQDIVKGEIGLPRYVYLIHYLVSVLFVHLALQHGVIQKLHEALLLGDLFLLLRLLIILRSLRLPVVVLKNLLALHLALLEAAHQKILEIVQLLFDGGPVLQKALLLLCALPTGYGPFPLEQDPRRSRIPRRCGDSLPAQGALCIVLLLKGHGDLSHLRLKQRHHALALHNLHVHDDNAASQFLFGSLHRLLFRFAQKLLDYHFMLSPSPQTVIPHSSPLHYMTPRPVPCNNLLSIS